MKMQENHKKTPLKNNEKANRTGSERSFLTRPGFGPLGPLTLGGQDHLKSMKMKQNHVPSSCRCEQLNMWTEELQKGIDQDIFAENLLAP